MTLSQMINRKLPALKMLWESYQHDSSWKSDHFYKPKAAMGFTCSAKPVTLAAGSSQPVIADFRKVDPLADACVPFNAIGKTEFHILETDRIDHHIFEPKAEIYAE